MSVDPVAPVPIDVATWPRAEQFEHFRTRVPCSFAMTVEVDVTELVDALRTSRRKTYPTQVWAVATAVNRHAEMRMTVHDDGPAVWPVVHPLFTVLNPERETFAGVWTEFDPDYATFCDRAEALLAEHRGATSMFPQGVPPPNTFDVSSLPWTSFTAFSIQVEAGSYLAPIVTLGRHVERDGRVLMPLAVQVHHAAADGLHVARVVEDLRALVAEPDWVV